MTVHRPILWQLVSHPRAIASIDDRRTTRNFELLIAIYHIASAIEARCQSRTVGVLLPTGGGFPAAAIAAMTLGKTVVPLNYLLKKEELQSLQSDLLC